MNWPLPKSLRWLAFLVVAGSAVSGSGCRDGEPVRRPTASGSSVKPDNSVERGPAIRSRPLVRVVKDDGSGDFEMLELSAGDLRIAAWDNTYSPNRLSGIRSLLNLRDAPDYQAFRVALNFEHVISGHRRPMNEFSPRHGPYRLRKIDETSVEWTRRAADSPWKLASTMTLSLAPPNAIDFRFSCTPGDAEVFGRHGYAVLFWANYMNPLTDVDMHFRGVTGPDSEEEWISVQAPQTDFLHRHGGVYRSRDSARLPVDDDLKSPWSVVSYEYPRFARPFFYARADRGMVLIMMFDRMRTTEDEIRFAMYRFQVKPESRRPAWDFQYVIRQVEVDRRYGFSGRLVWKKFAGAADCQAEYDRWRRGLDQSSATAPRGSLRTSGAR